MNCLYCGNCQNHVQVLTTESIFSESAPQIKALDRNLSAFSTLFAPGKSWDNVRSTAAPYTEQVHEQVEKTHKNELRHREHSQDHLKGFDKSHLIVRFLDYDRFSSQILRGREEEGGAKVILLTEIDTQSTLQRTNTKNLNQIFPAKESRGHSPNFHIHVSVSDLHIPTIDLPIQLQEICGPILGIYKSLTDTRMWKLGPRPCNSQKRNT